MSGDVASPNAAHRAMVEESDLVHDLLGGTRAMRAAGLIVAAMWFFRPASPLGVATAARTLRPNDPETVAHGQKLCAAHCASWHGARLEGQPKWRVRLADGLLPAPPHDASGHTWHYGDAYLVAVTKYRVARLLGQPYPNVMPIYDGVLSDKEIVAVLSYIKS